MAKATTIERPENMTPHKCPVCDGTGRRPRKPGKRRKVCRACDGDCVLWGPDPAPTFIPSVFGTALTGGVDNTWQVTADAVTVGPYPNCDDVVTTAGVDGTPHYTDTATARN